MNKLFQIPQTKIILIILVFISASLLGTKIRTEWPMASV